MMTLRARLFLVATVVILVILSISIFLIVMSKKKTAPVTETTPTTTDNIIDTTNFPAQLTQPAATTVPAGVTVKPPTSEEVQKNAAQQMAKIFIERYGSYSTDNDYQNIREVETLVTPNLWATLSKKIGAPINGGEFYGVTTKAITTSIVDWAKTSAAVEINTMRTENKNGNILTSNQKVKVTVLQSGDQWVVDKFEWLK